jgi:hypothetical protein
MKRAIEILGWLTAVALFAFASHAVLAANRAHAQGQPSAAPAPRGLVRQDGRGAQDPAAEPRTRERKTREREDLSPASIMREARTIYVSPTNHLEKKYLEYKLQKYRELDDWELALVADPSAADLVITFDKTALNYIFTITDRRTSIIVTSGKCIAVNGRLAAEYLGKEIIKKIRDVRAGSDRKSRKKQSRDDEEDDEWSES